MTGLAARGDQALTPRGQVIDALLATLLVALTLITLPHLHSWEAGEPWQTAGPGPPWLPGGPGHPWPAAGGGLDVTATVMVVAAGAATALRRRWPLPMMLLAVVATSLYLVLGYPYGPIFAFVALTVYMVARRLSLGPAAGWSLLALALVSAHLLTTASIGVLGLAPATVWVAVPFSVGMARRAVTGAAVREREAADQRLVDAERLRLSQEVHDVVGHGLAAIQMQADIALHVQEKRPEQAQEALQRISQASGEALDELRGVLAAVHPDAGDSRAPTPGLARIGDLVHRVRQAGVDVTLETTGTSRPLPPATDVAAYRVLQESLTNVVKHSPHPAATVHIEQTRGAVQLTVTNQALAAGETEGMGISGMRRRVTQVGGTFQAGPDHARGTYTVRARFPRLPEEVT